MEVEERGKEISPEAPGSRSQSAKSTEQTDSDSLAAPDFNMLRRPSVPKHFKLEKFEMYTLALGCTVTQCSRHLDDDQNPPFNL